MDHQKLFRLAASQASLEDLMCSPIAFGLPATPLQKAIFRIIDGQPLGDLAKHPDVLDAVGDTALLPSTKPREVVILGGIRTGKSLMTAAAAIRASQTCDLGVTRSGEIPRVSILSLDMDKASVVFRDHMIGTLNESKLLQSLLVKEPLADSLQLYHPSGRPIEVKVVAGRRAGGSLVSRWAATVIFDEAARMVGSDEGVVNLDVARSAVIGRLLKGAQILYPSSPHAPFGPVYDMVREFWGVPSPDIVVIKGKGPSLNPLWWTPEQCESVKRRDPDAYRTDVLCEFLTPDESLFSSSLLEEHTRKSPERMPYEPRQSYCAAMDPGTRGNSWTLVISTRNGRKLTVACAVQWTGSKSEPLMPSDVLRQIAEICAEYGVSVVYTDQYMIDALVDTAGRFNLTLSNSQLTEGEKAKRYLSLRTRLLEGELELPPIPSLLADLRRVRRKATQSGIAIHLPLTGDGRHCDYAPAWMLAMTSPLQDIQPEPKSPHEAERERMLSEARKRFVQRKDSWI